jgi:hypothetical protein
MIRDLELEKVSTALDVSTTYGRDAFFKGLTAPIDDVKELKRRQCALLALKSQPQLLSTIREKLVDLSNSHVTAAIDDALTPPSNLFTESVHQVLWAKDSYGAFLNKSSLVLQILIFWKTIFLPGFAILAPLLGILVPYIFLRIIQSDYSVQDYLTQLRAVILKQISVPSFLQARGEDDRIGGALEMLFIGLTIAMFMSGIWNQIAAALHVRAIWNDIDARGVALRRAVHAVSGILAAIDDAPTLARRGLRDIAARGANIERAWRDVATAAPLVVYGAAWNANERLLEMKEWIGYVDALCAIAARDDICFPHARNDATNIVLKDVHHPLLRSCVSNSVALGATSPQHAILTGPNRGGKSSFLKSVGLAVLTAQTWGFAWARSMTWSPFTHIRTALESVGTLGVASTFEAEIDYARSVLEIQDARVFVLMDEIFHSTNAHDGVEASKLFLSQLYDCTQAASIIATHYAELPKIYAPHASSLMMVARDGAHGRLEYTYQVAAGVSTKSSVLEICAERGLIKPSLASQEPRSQQ